MRKTDFSWLTVWVPAYHGAWFWRDVALLTLVTKILMRAISNVHAGGRLPNPALNLVLFF